MTMMIAVDVGSMVIAYWINGSEIHDDNESSEGDCRSKYH